MKFKKPAEKCIVPACENYTGMPGRKIFFRVPSTGHKSFRKWTRFVHLSGNRSEMICNEHFCQTDVVANSRLKLKNCAVPSTNLPARNPKVQLGGVCSVSGCPTKTRRHLEPFPAKNSVLQRWKCALGLQEFSSTAGLMVCHRHFAKSDFQKVISTYLKPTAVPSRKIVPLVRVPKRHFLAGVRPKHLEDHNYNRYIDFSRSNRICYVAGCRSRATAQITLHSFPLRTDSRFNVWIDYLRCKITPTKNSKVCSLHFDRKCYVPGGKHLKKDAIPTLRLPNKTNHTNELFSSSSKESIDSPEPIHPEPAKDANGPSLITSSISLHNVQDTADEPEQTNANIGSKGDTRNSASFGEVYEFDETSPIILEIDDERYKSDVPNVQTETDENYHDFPGTSHLNSSKHSTLNDTHCTACDQKKRSEFETSTSNNQTTDRVGCSTCLLSDLLLTDKEVNTWTGLPSLALLQEICLAARRLESKGGQRKFAMHTTDRVILTLSKLKQNISFEALGCLFKLSGVTASKYFSHMIPILSSLLRQFIHWPTKEEIKENVPLCFREHFPNVTIILDCTEVAVASLKCLNCRIASYSNYKCRRTIKFLVGVTPAGLISFVSHAYSGKASDKFIFNSERLIDRLEPHVDEVMVDKGVSIEAECSSKCIKLHIPPFMRGERLTPLEATRNEAIARARIHVERVIQRIKVFSILNDSITTNTLVHIDDIIKIVCGIVNLSPPVLKDDKF